MNMARQCIGAAVATAILLALALAPALALEACRSLRGFSVCVVWEVVKGSVAREPG